MADQDAVGTALCERYAGADVDSHIIEPADLWTSRIPTSSLGVRSRWVRTRTRRFFTATS